MKTDVKKLLLLFMSLFVCLGASAYNWYLVGGEDGWDASKYKQFVENSDGNLELKIDDWYDFQSNGGFLIIRTDGSDSSLMYYLEKNSNTVTDANTVFFKTSYGDNKTNATSTKKYFKGTITIVGIWTTGDNNNADGTVGVTFRGEFADEKPSAPIFPVKPTPTDKYTIAGNINSWNADDTSRQLFELQDAMDIFGQSYTYYIPFEYGPNVTVVGQNQGFKITKDGSWGTSYGVTTTAQVDINTTLSTGSNNIIPKSEIKYVFLNPTANKIYLWDGTTPLNSDVTVTLNLNGNSYEALWCKCGDEAAKAMTISNGVATLTVPAGYTGISIYSDEACTKLVKTFEKSADNTYSLDIAMTAITLNAAARGWSSAWVHYTYVDASVVTRATLIGAKEMTPSGNGTYSADIPATYTSILFSETKTGTQVTFDVNATGNYVLEEVPAVTWSVVGEHIGTHPMTYDAATGCWHVKANYTSTGADEWLVIKFVSSELEDGQFYGKPDGTGDRNLNLNEWYQTSLRTLPSDRIWSSPIPSGEYDIWFNAETKRALVGDYFAYETPKEYGDYYLIGDINGVVDGTGKGWNLNDLAAKNNKWRFYKVDDEDVMVQAGKIDNNWYKLEVPASADGHNALCAQFKITDGQWNSDSNKGHEYTLDFDHGMQELGLSRTYYFRKYIQDNTAPNADQNSKYLYPYGFDAWGRIVELGMNKYTNTSSDKGTQWKGEPYEFENEEDFNNCVEYWSNELNTTIDEKIIKDYFDRYRTKAFDTTAAVDKDAATEIVSLQGGNKQYTANFHLETNRITPAEGQKSVVIYFLPPDPNNVVDNVSRGGKMFVYGKSQRLYFYYFNNEVEKDRVKEVRVSVASSTNFNKGYYIDRATSMGPFELVEEPTKGPDGKTYPYYWRKLMTRGYEDRHNQGDSFTAQFTTVIEDESGVKKTTLSERKSINCGDVYLMDVTDSYKVRFRYHPAANETRTISEVRMIVATPTAGDKALAVRSRTDAAVATETTVDNYSWDDSNYYPMTLVDKWYTTDIDSRMGSDYIVFRVTFSDNKKETFYYDPYNRSQWIKMNNSDKDVHVYAAGEDNLNIGRLLVSHLSGDATRTDNIQLIIIPTVEDKEYYHYGHGGSYQYQYTDGTMFGAAQEYPMDDILYSYCITQDNTPVWQPWTNEPFKNVDLSSFAPGDYLIYAGVKYEDADIIHSVVAEYTIADTSANKLHIESLEAAGTTGECGCVVPPVDNFIQGDVSKQHHMKLTIAGDLVGSGANVEWIKYDNGIRQGYYTKVNGEPVFNEVLPEHEASWMHSAGGTEYAHMTYNFGKVLYLAIVTPADTPAPAPARAPRAANSIGTTPITLTNVVAKALHEAIDHTTGIESVSVDTEDAEPVYYNLQGVRIDNPAAGHIYIEVRGTAVRKVRL